MKYPIIALSLLGTLASGCSATHIGTEIKSIAANDIHTLVVTTEAGDLDIQGSEGVDSIETTLEIFSTKPGLMGSNSMPTIEFELSIIEEGVAELTVKFPDDMDMVWADAYVVLPTSLNIELIDNSGDININQVGSLLAIDGSGDFRASDIMGPVSIDDDSGDLSLRNVMGDVNLVDGSGDINVSDIAGNLNLLDDSGGIVVEAMAGDLVITDDAGDIAVDSLVGDVYIIDGSGDIHLTDIEGIATVSDESGDIHANNVGELRIESDGSGDVHED